MGTQCSSAPLAERNFEKLHLKSASIVKYESVNINSISIRKLKTSPPKKVTKNG